MHLPGGGCLKYINLIMAIICEQTLWNDERLLKEAGWNSAVSTKKNNASETTEKNSNRNII